MDCLTFPIATGQEETRRDAIETISEAFVLWDRDNRLVGEFAKILDLMAERLREEDCEPRVSKVVSFRN